jgi:hypothetical protein
VRTTEPSPCFFASLRLCAFALNSDSRHRAPLAASSGNGGGARRCIAAPPLRRKTRGPGVLAEASRRSGIPSPARTVLLAPRVRHARS